MIEYIEDEGILQNNDSEIIFSSNINKTLNDNQIIIKLLASGVRNVTNSVSTL